MGWCEHKIQWVELERKVPEKYADVPEINVTFTIAGWQMLQSRYL